MPVTISLPTRHTGPLLRASSVAVTSVVFEVPPSIVVRTSVTSLPTYFCRSFCGSSRSVLVVLLDDRQLARLGERSQVHRGRVDGGGDVLEAQVMIAGRQRHPAHVADQGEAAVVHGEAEVLLLAAVAHDERAAVIGARRGLLGPGPDDADRRGDAGQCEDGKGELSDGHGVSSRMGFERRTNRRRNLAAIASAPRRPRCRRSARRS